MRVSLVLGALVSAVGAVTAQTADQNQLNYWDEGTEYTSRASVSGNPGHVSQAYSHGHTAGLKKLTYVHCVVQDQDLSTQEKWGFKICTVGKNGFPDYKGGSVLVANYQLPVGSGVGAYNVWVHNISGAKIPFTMPNTQGGDWHFAWQFVAAANWATDGISVHMSQAAPGLPSQQNTKLCHNFNGRNYHREIPRTEGGKQIVEEFGWSEQPGGQNPPRFQDRAWRLTLGFEETILQGAFQNKAYNAPTAAAVCKDPNYGYGAFDPDFSDVGTNSPGRFDNYAWTMKAGTSFGNGIGIMFWSTSLSPVPLPTPWGDFWLNMADPLFGVGPIVIGTLDGQGQATFNWNLGPNTSPLRKMVQGIGSLSAQGISIKGSPGNAKLELSNVFTMRTLLQPGASKKDTAIATGKTIDKPATARFIQVTNNGHVHLMVQQVRKPNTAVGPPVRVGSRSSAFIVASPAANGVTYTAPVTGTPNNPCNFTWEYK